MNNKIGFTLIEILITVAIVSILAAIAIPSYLGIQERARKGSIIRIAEASIPELQAWVLSANKGAFAVGQGLLTEVDINGNGTIEATETNFQLASTGVVANWLTTHNINKKEQSPWGAAPLWVGYFSPDLATCEGLAGAGQITLCYEPADDASIRQIFIVIRDVSGTSVGTAGAGNIIFSKTLIQ